MRDEDALVTTMYEEACTYSSTVGEQGAGAGEEEKAEKQRSREAENETKRLFA